MQVYSDRMKMHARTHSAFFNTSRKRKGISLSNEKSQQKIEKYSSTYRVPTTHKIPNEKNKRVNNFIIFDVNRQQWECQKRQSSVELPKKNDLSSSLNMQSYQSVMEEANAVSWKDKQNCIFTQSMYPGIDTMRLAQHKRGQTSRVRQMRVRINEIQNRLNSLIQLTSFR